jgi:CrcB protein
VPTRLLLLAAAGAAGTLCRYGLAGLVQSGLGTRLPWSTLVVNVLGCLVAGILFGLFESRWAFSGEARDRAHRLHGRVHDVLQLYAGDQ